MHKRKSAVLLLATSLQVKRTYKKRQYVSKPDTREEIRQKLAYQNSSAEMRLKDLHLFHNYLGMSAEMFDKLLNIVDLSITKSVNGIQERQ